MGNKPPSPPQPEINEYLNKITSEAIMSTKNSCQSKIDASQAISQTCKPSDAVAIAYANSASCQKSKDPTTITAFQNLGYDAKTAKQMWDSLGDSCYACIQSGNTQTARIAFDANCLITNKNEADFSNKLKSSVDSTIKKKDDVFGKFLDNVLGGDTGNGPLSKFKNEISNKITQENVTEILNNITTMQTIAQDSTGGAKQQGNTQDFNIDFISKAINQNEGYASARNDLAATLKTLYDKETTGPLDVINNWLNQFGAIGKYFIIGAMVIGVILIIGAAIVLTNKRFQKTAGELGGKLIEARGGGGGGSSVSNKK